MPPIIRARESIDFCQWTHCSKDFGLPNVTTVVQHMDQGVIVSVKQRYWADILRTMANDAGNMTASWKKITVLDAIYGISQARRIFFQGF